MAIIGKSKVQEHLVDPVYTIQIPMRYGEEWSSFLLASSGLPLDEMGLQSVVQAI